MNYGFSGQCTPDKAEAFNFESFSVGIYPIVAKSNGKGIKKGKVVVRVSGSNGNVEAVYNKAKEIVELLEKDCYTGPKIVKVK